MNAYALLTRCLHYYTPTSRPPTSSPLSESDCLVLPHPDALSAVLFNNLRPHSHLPRAHHHKHG